MFLSSCQLWANFLFKKIRFFHKHFFNIPKTLNSFLGRWLFLALLSWTEHTLKETLFVGHIDWFVPSLVTQNSCLKSKLCVLFLSQDSDFDSQIYFLLSEKNEISKMIGQIYFIQDWMVGYESPCRVRAAEPELPILIFLCHTNLYLWYFIVAWTERSL